MGWIADLLQEIPSAARYKVELEQLASEHEILKTKLSAAEAKIQNLEEKLIERLGQRLEEVKEQILQLLATHPNVTEAALSSGMTLNVQLVTFHLTELENMKFVHGSYSTIDDTEWSLAHEGRAYLVSYGLLS